MITDDRVVSTKLQHREFLLLCDAMGLNPSGLFPMQDGTYSRFVTLDNGGSWHQSSITSTSEGAALDINHVAEGSTFGVGISRSYSNHGEELDSDAFGLGLDSNYFQNGNDSKPLETSMSQLNSYDVVFANTTSNRTQFSVEYLYEY